MPQSVFRDVEGSACACRRRTALGIVHTCVVREERHLAGRAGDGFEVDGAPRLVKAVRVRAQARLDLGKDVPDGTVARHRLAPQRVCERPARSGDKGLSCDIAPRRRTARRPDAQRDASATPADAPRQRQRRHGNGCPKLPDRRSARAASAAPASLNAGGGGAGMLTSGSGGDVSSDGGVGSVPPVVGGRSDGVGTASLGLATAPTSPAAGPATQMACATTCAVRSCGRYLALKTFRTHTAELSLIIPGATLPRPGSGLARSQPARRTARCTSSMAVRAVCGDPGPHGAHRKPAKSAGDTPASRSSSMMVRELRPILSP